MRPILLCGVLALTPQLVVTGQDRPNVGPRDFQAWVAEHSIPLDSLDPVAIDPAAFAFLDQALVGKRVVYLGESDHFVAERIEFRLLLIRELMRRGFRRIGMEMGLSDGKRIDHYLATGDESWLARVALYGYRGDLRDDRVDEVPGWTDDAESEFTRVVLDEAKGFQRALRAINAELPAGEPRLAWFGYDLSFRPGGGYADAAEVLSAHLDSSLLEEVKRRMQRVPDESRLEEAIRLDALTALLDEHRGELVTALGEVGFLELRRSLSRMADAFRFIEAMQDRRDWDRQKVIAGLGDRERRMADNFDEHLAEFPADEKIILLGHMLHLSKSSEALHTQAFGQMWTSIGTWLARRLPGEVYAIWLLHDHGDHGSAGSTPPVQPFRSPHGSIERILARVHPILVLPFGSGDPREAWLAQERVFSSAGSPCRAVLPALTDCLFFVERAHEPGRR